MFEISEQLILEQSDEIFGVSQISWESSPWKQVYLVNDEEVISLSHAKVFVFSDSVFCLGKMNQNPISNTVWERGMVQRCITIQNFGHNWRRTDGIRVEYFPRFTTLQLVHEVQKLMSKMGEPEQFQGRIIFMSMFNDIIRRNNDNVTECIANSTLVSLFAKRCPAGRWSFFGLGSETKWYPTYNERPQGEWHRVAELMMIKFGESGHPVFRATSPLSRGTLKAKEVENYLYFSVPMVIRLKLFFALSFLSISSVSTEESQIYVKSTVAVEQEFAQANLLQKQPTSGKPSTTRSIYEDLYWCRIPENSWSRTNFMTKHTDEFLQFAEPVTCREHTLLRDDKSTDPKGWISREHRNWARIGSHNQLTTR